MNRRTFFYDTWGFLALANATDPHHAVAEEADRALKDAGYVSATSDYILDETLTGLHVAAGAKVALEGADLLLARIAAGELLLFEVSASRRGAALTLFRRLAPQAPRLSFTDCTSLAIMREQRIELAFTADRNFHRAGRGIRPLFERVGKELVARLPGGALASRFRKH
jgi:predicted nucleic acid-binding protein